MHFTIIDETVLPLHHLVKFWWKMILKLKCSEIHSMMERRQK